MRHERNNARVVSLWLSNPWHPDRLSERIRFSEQPRDGGVPVLEDLLINRADLARSEEPREGDALLGGDF
jgi:hypothetical protein